MRHQSVPDFFAVAREHLDHPGWHAGLEAELPEDERGQGGLLGRLEDHAVATDERGGHLVGGVYQGAVPGHDAGTDADRSPHRVAVHGRTDGVDRPVDLGRPTGVIVPHEVSGLGHLHLGHAERLARVERLQLAEHGGVLVDQVGQAKEHLRHFDGGAAVPAPGVEGAPRFDDGGIHVVVGGVGQLGHDLPGRGLVDRHGAVGRGGRQPSPIKRWCGEPSAAIVASLRPSMTAAQGAAPTLGHPLGVDSAVMVPTAPRR